MRRSLVTIRDEGINSGGREEVIKVVSMVGKEYFLNVPGKATVAIKHWQENSNSQNLV